MLCIILSDGRQDWCVLRSSAGTSVFFALSLVGGIMSDLCVGQVCPAFLSWHTCVFCIFTFVGGIMSDLCVGQVCPVFLSYHTCVFCIFTVVGGIMSDLCVGQVCPVFLSYHTCVFCIVTVVGGIMFDLCVWQVCPAFLSRHTCFFFYCHCCRRHDVWFVCRTGVSCVPHLTHLCLLYYHCCRRNNVWFVCETGVSCVPQPAHLSFMLSVVGGMMFYLCVGQVCPAFLGWDTCVWDRCVLCCCYLTHVTRKCTCCFIYLFFCSLMLPLFSPVYLLAMLPLFHLSTC